MIVLIEGYFWFLWLAGIIYTFEVIEKQPGYEQGARLAARVISFVLATIVPLIYMCLGIYALAAVTTFIQERDRVK
jgi:hypothetical protein